MEIDRWHTRVAPTSGVSCSLCLEPRNPLEHLFISPLPTVNHRKTPSAEPGAAAPFDLPLPSSRRDECRPARRKSTVFPWCAHTPMAKTVTVFPFVNTNTDGENWGPNAPGRIRDVATQPKCFCKKLKEYVSCCEFDRSADRSILNFASCVNRSRVCKKRKNSYNNHTLAPPYHIPGTRYQI